MVDGGAGSDDVGASVVDDDGGRPEDVDVDPPLLPSLVVDVLDGGVNPTQTSKSATSPPQSLPSAGFHATNSTWLMPWSATMDAHVSSANTNQYAAQPVAMPACVGRAVGAAAVGWATAAVRVVGVPGTATQ